MWFCTKPQGLRGQNAASKLTFNWQTETIRPKVQTHTKGYDTKTGDVWKTASYFEKKAQWFNSLKWAFQVKLLEKNLTKKIDALMAMASENQQNAKTFGAIRTLYSHTMADIDIFV